MGIKVSEFGKTSKGKIAHIYTLVNGKGMALEVTDYGATMVSILAPDAKGRSKEGVVVLSVFQVGEAVPDSFVLH